MLEFDDPAFPHKELTSAIIGAAFEVHNELGYGFLERVYHRALEFELLRRGLRAELEKRITVRYKEAMVGTMTPICLLKS